jgi:hypothetical protein
MASFRLSWVSDVLLERRLMRLRRPGWPLERSSGERMGDLASRGGYSGRNLVFCREM